MSELDDFLTSTLARQIEAEEAHARRSSLLASHMVVAAVALSSTTRDSYQ